MEIGLPGLLIGWAGCLRNVHDSARIPRGPPLDRSPLDFAPDDLAGSADGQLHVAGQRTSALDVPGCAAVEAGACALPSVVFSIDLVALDVSPPVDDDPATVLGVASIAVEHDGGLWIGSFAGDRIVNWQEARQSWKTSSSNVR